jgi:hypothetical protein
MNFRLLFVLSSVLLSLPAIASAGEPATPVYHVDALQGNDESGDGSAGRPLKTLGHALMLLSGGETVVLHNGEYGELTARATASGAVFSKWVTVKAAAGARPKVERVVVGGPKGPPDQTGGFDVHLRLEGLTIVDGVQIDGGRHWALVGCRIERRGPWTGCVDNIEKTAVSFRCGADILIQDCEITRTGTGIAGRGHAVRVLRNHIHGGSHDGIRVTGFWDSLIEGNRIHDFDDGVTDAETADKGRWSRHCDLIHIFIPGPGLPGWQNHNVVFRNNVLYDTEAQSVQFNNYYKSPVRNEKIVFENNVFGPSHANLFNNADPCDGLIFRHNTVVVLPEPRKYHRWLLNNYTVRISGRSTGVQVYNNILGRVGWDRHEGGNTALFDWNLIQLPGTPRGVGGSRAYGRFTLIGGDPQFVDPEAFDGRLKPGSPAIHAGTRRFAPTPVFAEDREGTPRDVRPDLGSWEFRGQSPAAEPGEAVHTGKKTVFVDDFEDGHYGDVDPWLDGSGQQGLSWRQSETSPFRFYVTNAVDLLDRNQLCTPVGRQGKQRTACLLSEQGGNWRDYDLKFDAFNAYLPTGGGPLLLVQDERNAYWLDIARDAGKLLRLMTDEQGNPVTEQLAEAPSLRLPHRGKQTYLVSVRHKPEGIEFRVDVGADGSVELTHADADTRARTVFSGGGIGFRDHTEQVHLGIRYDNVRVDVHEFK